MDLREMLNGMGPIINLGKTPPEVIGDFNDDVLDFVKDSRDTLMSINQRFRRDVYDAFVISLLKGLREIEKDCGI
jgi:hypothetical protein